MPSMSLDRSKCRAAKPGAGAGDEVGEVFTTLGVVDGVEPGEWDFIQVFRQGSRVEAEIGVHHTGMERHRVQFGESRE